MVSRPIWKNKLSWVLQRLRPSEKLTRAYIFPYCTLNNTLYMRGTCITWGNISPNLPSGESTMDKNQTNYAWTLLTVYVHLCLLQFLGIKFAQQNYKLFRPFLDAFMVIRNGSTTVPSKAPELQLWNVNTYVTQLVSCLVIKVRKNKNLKDPFIN